MEWILRNTLKTPPNFCQWNDLYIKKILQLEVPVKSYDCSSKLQLKLQDKEVWPGKLEDLGLVPIDKVALQSEIYA